MRRTAARTALAGAVAAALLMGSGCATYTARMADLRPELAAGDFEGALATLEDRQGGKEMLLYWLERGLVLHYADRWQESNEAFAAAERTGEELYSRSLSEAALSLVTSDESISYRARPFEMAMIPYYRAMNYVYLGERESALVEARKASLLMARYVDASVQGLDGEAVDALERTRNDPFLLYLSGMLYDWDGELNDAFIAYRNAAAAYAAGAELLSVEIPPTLATDLDRTAARLGFAADLEQIRAAHPEVFAAAARDPAAAAWPAGHGQVVLLLETSYVPQKTQTRVDVPIFKGEAYGDTDRRAAEMAAGLHDMRGYVKGRDVAYWLAITLPELPQQAGDIHGARVSATAAGAHVRTCRAANLEAMTRITFAAEYGKVLVKTIARGLTKYLATRQVARSESWLGTVVNIVGAATERADTRAWLTLPRTIDIARLTLPAGSYDLEVELVDAAGRSLGRHTVPDVRVRAGDWTFLNHRVF
ncbi:MAG: hypothetical protein R6X25_07765 [Candidatus Krumholzibacteriia bacterium]